MEVLLGIFLLWGGYEWGSHSGEREPVDIEPEIGLVSELPTYERGRYYRTEDGYFISNLTSAPQISEGCDNPILVTDLSKPAQDQKRHVRLVEVSCEV